MKNILSLLIVTFAIFLTSNVNGYSQCDSCAFPYTPQTATYVHNSSCSITINYCLNCAPTGHPVMSLCSITVPNNSYCNGISIGATFWENIRQTMIENAVA